MTTIVPMTAEEHRAANEVAKRLSEAQAARGEGKSGTKEQRDLIKSIRQEWEDIWRAREPDYPNRRGTQPLHRQPTG